MKMPGCELVIDSPCAGECVTHSFNVRGTAPDIAAVVKVWLIERDNAKKWIEGNVVGPVPNPGGEPQWFARFTEVQAGAYYLIAAIETRMSLHVAPPAQAFPSTIAVSILTPLPGATVSNPITVYGSVNPPSCAITCTITSGGTDYPGAVTGPDANGNWSASFGTIPSGAATITVTATQNGNSTTTTEGITVK
jgi:hypothetical protein